MKINFTLILFFFSFSIFSQGYIYINTSPGYLLVNCDDSSEGYDTQLIYDWIDDYIATASVTNECTDPGSTYTWTHDYTGQASTGCNSPIFVEFTVTNECGEYATEYGDVNIEDFEGPPLDPPTISEHTLYCDNDGNILGLQEIIDNNYYFTVQDDYCTGGPVELMHYAINLQCDQMEYIEFWTEDECGNYSQFHTVLFITITPAITINSSPTSLYLSCNDSTVGYDVQLVYNWIDNYILNANVTNDCTDPSSNYTWSHNFVEQAVSDCYASFQVEFIVTNECGVSDSVTEYVFIEDNEGPPLDPPTISEHTLYCDNDGNIVGLQEIIDNNYYFTVQDDYCTDGPVELMHDNINLQCDQMNYISFWTQDECFNYSEFYQVLFNTIVLDVEFVNNNNPVSESTDLVEVCLQISHVTPEDVTVEVSYTGGTATPDLDYIETPTTQSIVFPANSSDQQCFTVNILEDNLVEANETILFEIASITSNIMSEVGFKNTSKITILDNDDNDNDDIENSIDNCPNSFNPFQEDFDNDGLGDVCDDDTTISEISEFQDYIFINKTYSGVIVKSLDNKCWVIVVQNDGSLNTVAVTCPD